MTIRVLIADDQAMVRTGIRLILESEPDLEVVGEARDGAEAVAKARRLRPDVVLMDVRMPGVDGIDATRELRTASPPVEARVLILTTYDLDENVFAALRAGADGFLLKHAPSDDLIRAIRTVAQGDALLSPEVTRRVIAEFASIPQQRSAPPPELDLLTQREREVFDLLARGRSNAEIARALFVQATTVKTHVAHALRKLGLRDRAAAVIYAFEHGLVDAAGSPASGEASGGSAAAHEP
ncbi:MAG TPA: response regulator transcription factor [Nitriliruptorales bacterium]|nr:response regulator transcription factor [Nitriliruptorales bacterium]